MPPAAPYSWLTFLQARQQLANRLYDPGMVFWSDAELKQYIWDALRTWNAHTAFWRDEFTFPFVTGTTWYDITDLTVAPNTLRPYTVTAEDLYTLMEYSLLEPAVGSAAWTGSAQFTVNDLIQAVQRRRDELLSLTSITTTRRTTPAVAGRISLSDRVIDVRRLAYLPDAIFSRSPSTVWPDDAWAEQSFQPGYLQNPPGTPEQYLQTTEPPITFVTDRDPAYGGDYEVLTIDAGPVLVASGLETLSIPDDWTHVLRWGALADLLNRESNSRDPLRAAYCEQRYRMGIKLLMTAPAILTARIANKQLQIDSVRAADLYDASWQARAAAEPNLLFHSGMNLIAASPVPDAGPYTGTLTVVENAPLPSADGDPVQVSRDDFECILDLAQHTAAFKQGGAEFISTMPLLMRFLQQTAVYGAKLQEIAEFTSTLQDLSRREVDMNPVMTPSGEEAAGSAGNAS